MKRWRDVLIAIGLVLLMLALYRKVVRLWWTYDDAYLVHLAVDHSVADEFFSASVWPQKLFTPLVMVVYEADMAAFGLDPARWFVVHLIGLALATLAFYAALRQWFKPAPAGAGALLLLASVPLCSLVTEISGIHYFLGIFFGSLATIAYVAALRRRDAAGPAAEDGGVPERRRLAGWPGAVSAPLYLVAMLAKETVIPLPVLFLALPERNLRTRAKSTIPHWIALALYLFWRRAVIGTILGGYGWAIDRSEWAAMIASLPKKIVLASAGANVWLGVALIAIMLIGICFIGRRGVVLFVVALALATGPILPVSKEMQRRYALMPWLCWSIAFVAGARDRKILLSVVPALMLAVNRQEWGYEFGRTQRMSDEARFFFEMPPETFLRRPTVPPAAMGELNWLKTVHLRKPSGAAWFYDDYFLCTVPAMPKRAWEYQPAKRAVVEITSELPAIAKRHCGSMRNDAPLSAQFEYRDAALFWKFGPYADGKYRVLLADGVQAFDVPRQDGFRLPDIPGLTLRIRYDSPEGWFTYSPELTLDFVRQPRLNWSRR